MQESLNPYEAPQNVEGQPYNMLRNIAKIRAEIVKSLAAFATGAGIGVAVSFADGSPEKPAASALVGGVLFFNAYVALREGMKTKES